MEIGLSMPLLHTGLSTVVYLRAYTCAQGPVNPKGDTYPSIYRPPIEMKQSQQTPKNMRTVQFPPVLTSLYPANPLRNLAQR